MKLSFTEILEKNGWWKRNPSTPEEVKILSEKFNDKLPNDYMEILKFSNGGSLYGFQTPFTIYSITEVLALYREFDLYENIPESIIFGGDGGGTIYVYDLRSEKKQILFFREDDISYDNIVYQAEDLLQLVNDIVVNNKKIN